MIMTRLIPMMAALFAGVINATSASNLNQRSDDVSSTLVDNPYNFALLQPNGTVLAGKPATVYIIFYGNFTDVEQFRIINYVSHVSNSSLTKPDRWSAMAQLTDANGVHVNKELKFGGSVVDMYSRGMNISTSHQTNIPYDPTESDANLIITSHIGEGEGKLPYDPYGLYAVITAPEVNNWDNILNSNGKRSISYGAFHIGYSNSTLANNQTAFINQIFIHTLSAYTNSIRLSQSSNGDTGRRVIDMVVKQLNHEIMEAVSDPEGFTGYNDVANPDGGIGEVVDACEQRSFYMPNIRYTESSMNATGRFYNTIVNGYYYTVEDTWSFDKDGAQSCYSEVKDPRVTEFKSMLSAKNPVTAAMGNDSYNGPVQIPCRAYYMDRYHAGYSNGTNVCHSWFNGTSYTNRTKVNAPLIVPNNFHVLSQNHAHYQWLKVDETNAMMIYDDDVNPPTTANNRVFVAFQDNFNTVKQADGSTIPVDKGAYYFCRAFVNGAWVVGETTKFQSTCDMAIDGVFTHIPKTDPSVAFLVKPSPYRKWY
ncbi:hypothetical protein HDU76_006190 [Blyttiomyces sp. JEL0837]|nr:hypothetical protein HDU76_006190 [Blyttiomyces sp. JEL0837]